MDPSPVQTTASIKEDEWDTDGFVIPSLGIEHSDQNKIDSLQVEDSKLPTQAKSEENIYLGPHGAPPSQAKQQEQNTCSRRQRFKQKLKEAGRNSGTEHENKIENLRELVGGGKMPVIASKSSPRDWLDPHCHEAPFERRHLH